MPPFWWILFDVLSALALFLGATYFLCQEYRQIKKAGWGYLRDIWNYSDIIPPLVILAIILMDVLDKERNPKIQYTLAAIACFGMWVKILYFLRIFRQTGFFITMLLRVVSVSRIFFLLYTLMLCTFGCTFYILTASDKRFYSFIYDAYLLGLGEFDNDFSDTAVPLVCQFVFLAATLVILIVMLNLLIAIVSSAYEDIINTQQEANDYERISLIADVNDFILPRKKRQMCDRQEYLIKACIADGAGDEKKGVDE